MDTLLREKNQITLPGDVVQAAGLSPSDRISWRFEEGEIRGRKLIPQAERRISGKLIRRGGLLVLDTKGLKIEADAIGQAVREERNRWKFFGTRPPRSMHWFQVQFLPGWNRKVILRIRI